jgi:hypothetical protein
MLLRIIVKLFVTCYQNISKTKLHRHVYKIENMYHVPDYIQIPHEFFAPQVHLTNIQSLNEICGQTLGMTFTYKNKKLYPHMPRNINFFNYG